MGGRNQTLTRTSWIAAGWSLFYALYRLYYAAGGTIGRFGTPLSEQQWRSINATAGVLLLAAAILPIVMLRMWRNPRARFLLSGLCWIVTVACISHALIGIAQRVLSLTGLLTMRYPFWRTIDPREADLQALLFNEPWFLIQGLLWAAIAWNGAVRDSPRRSWWIGSAIAAVVASTIAGMLSTFGIIGRVIIG